MDIFKKAQVLSSAGEYDSCGPKMCKVSVSEGLGGIYHAKAEHKTCRLFKTLMTNACSFDCKYCGNSTQCKSKKASYHPEELASLFNHLHKKLDVNGLFLSSGVAGDPDRCTERMLDAVRLLRFRYKFEGYIHFKALPGTSYELIKQASELSTRMSINIEAPNKGVMDELSSCKEYKTDILKRQAWISNMKLSGGQTTQMIINRLATDKDVLKMVNWEYQELELKRVYYSAFKPVEGTPLEKEKAEPVARQNHLYNVDFLMRDYGFRLKEFDSIMDNGMLPHEDPKLALAKASLDGPVDLNEAEYNELIRVPGIGPETAQKLVQRRGKIKKFEDLHMLGGWVKRAKPFIIIEGKRQSRLGEF